MPAISYAIQTHPLRSDLARALLAQLEGAELASDPEPESLLRSPWRTYRHALDTTPAGATHRLVIQDDVILCRDFQETVAAAVAARPDRLLSFFVGGMPYEHARSVYLSCQQDLSWAELDYMRWCPAIALCWPVELIPPLLEYVDEQRWPEHFRADDEIIGRFLRTIKHRPLASVPSLVEHPDTTPSLIGRRARGGEDRGRIAACFIHPDCDPLSIDWTLGPA